MKLQCLLIDDEPPALRVLSRYISEIGTLEIAGLCNNAIEAMEVLRSRRVDIMFLDIKMPRILGTEFLKNLSQPPKVVFVTAYREYAVDGFELDAIDYLVKPVSFERFLKTVSKLHRVFGTESLPEATSPVVASDPFIYLKVDRDMRKVVVDQIIYIESAKDYVKVFLTHNRNLLVKQSISAMENLLSDHLFLRVHRSYIISLKRVTGFNTLSVHLSDVEVPIGRLYKRAVLEHLTNK